MYAVVSAYNGRQFLKSLNSSQLLSLLRISNLCHHAHVRNPRLAGMTGSEVLEKMYEPYSALPLSPSPSSHSLAMGCGAAHLWTLLNRALVWPDSSPLLHFPSNLSAQPSDCHRKAVKTFPSFCITALFPQHCLTIAIFYCTARFVYLLCRLHFPSLLSIH